MRLKVTLTRGDNTATVHARAPNIHGGVWVISERSRRRAFCALGLDPDPLTNHPGLVSSATIRAIDTNGWHTYTVWST